MKLILSKSFILFMFFMAPHILTKNHTACNKETGRENYCVNSEKLNLKLSGFPVRIATRIDKRSEVLDEGGKHGELPYLKNDFQSHDDSLAHLFHDLSEVLFGDCHVTIGFQNTFRNSSVLNVLAKLPNVKQILEIKTLNTFEEFIWRISNCRVVVYLLSNPEENGVLEFLNNNEMHKIYNIKGRSIVVAPNFATLLEVFESDKGLHTDNLLGFIPGSKYKWQSFLKVFTKSPPYMRVSTSQLYSGDFFQDQTRNFNGRVMKISALEFMPTMLAEKGKNGTILDFYGVDIKAIRTMGELLNFSVQFIGPPPGETFGTKLSRWNWTGMIGMVSRGESDIMGMRLFHTVDRVVVVDYCSSFRAMGLQFIARIPDPIPPWLAVVYPFDSNIWAAIIISLVMCNVFFYGIPMTYYKYIRGTKKPESWLIFIPLASQLKQDALQTVNSYSQAGLRIFAALLWLYCFMIANFYSSNLLAALTVPQIPRPLKSLKDIRDSALPIGVLTFLFPPAVDHDALQVPRSGFKIFKSERELMDAVLANEIVLMMNNEYTEFAAQARLYPGQEDPKRSLRKLKEALFSYPSGLMVKKNSILKDKFTLLLDWMMQAGLYDIWFKEAIKKFEKHQKKLYDGSSKTNDAALVNEPSGDETTLPLSFSHIEGVLMFFACGIGLSIIALTVEILWDIFQKRKKF